MTDFWDRRLDPASPLYGIGEGDTAEFETRIPAWRDPKVEVMTIEEQFEEAREYLHHVATHPRPEEERIHDMVLAARVAIDKAYVNALWRCRCIIQGTLVIKEK